MKDTPIPNAEKKGYLAEDFRIFYNLDRGISQVPFHYHDFHKIFLLLKGDVTYAVEEKKYELVKGDVILVPAGQIHRPLVEEKGEYERIILYISDEFFRRMVPGEGDLSRLFAESSQNHSYLIRLTGQARKQLEVLCVHLREAAADHSEYAGVSRRISAAALMLLLLRAETEAEEAGMIMSLEDQTENADISAVIRYIQEHLTDPDLNIDELAGHVARDRYYLMHLFKEETGYTIGQYMTLKRLFLARQLTDSGASATEACFGSGFKNYSAYYYAVNKMRGKGKDSIKE